ncbi:transglutaminaseTgpA domain-containing protein [Streptomyces sp. NBC_00102]|uniref:transglutaminaseTgpA domain-containing protein n=1 Tax=Streptomyces sp. NBC_00102 TaxID=2975652 RepID=UPI0022566C56|nr:transglutaminaseTgpA domain-containing protein [Streptomyces sp. NBC_00102]MCX5396504.1 transglutaminaseTgpA domain-containing protein [Streptomyces sp. NBC_00102]
MSGPVRLALCACAATLLAAGALLPLVDPWTWIFEAALLLVLQSAVGALARRFVPARAAAVGVQVLATLVLLTAAFASDRALLGVLPGPQAVQWLGDLLTAGTDDVSHYAIPAPMTDGIKLLLVAGVLLIGLLVDVLAVTLRSAAPAGLPLLALYSVAAGLSDGGANWLWFVLAASGYLLLLLAEGRDRTAQWGRLFGGPASGGPPSGARVKSPVRTGRRIGALALGVALLVPAALPALGDGLLGGLGTGKGRGGGGTISAVNPLVSLQDNLNQSENREVLTYRPGDGAPQSTYLRILSLDRFTGSEWLPSKRALTDVPDRFSQPAGLGKDVAVFETTSEITASDDYRQDYLPMPYPATRVRVDGRWRYEPEGRTLIGDGGQTTAGKRYEVSSLSVEPTAAQLAAAGLPPKELTLEYTEVPTSLPDVVAETAAQVTRGSANHYEQAVALQDWFASEGGFSYDTTVSSGTGTAAIARFLKDRRGFCVHFSFAMAAMARTLGIPARVAVGFTPGTPQANGAVSVGLRDAHAWPELYFEGVGWTRFEPTPTRGTVPSYTVPEAPTGAADTSAAPTASVSAQPSAAPSASESCSAPMRKEGACGPSAAPVAADTAGPGFPLGTVALVVLGAALVVLIPLSPMLWRTRLRARRLYGSGGRTPADTAARTLAVWQEITDTAWDHGIVPDEALTPRRAAGRIARLGGLDGEPAAALHRVAGAVELVLYAPRPQSPAGLAEDAVAAGAGLAGRVSRFARLRATFAPRSAVRVVWAVSERRTAWAKRFSERMGAAGRSLRPTRSRG